MAVDFGHGGFRGTHDAQAVVIWPPHNRSRLEAIVTLFPDRRFLCFGEVRGCCFLFTIGGNRTRVRAELRAGIHGFYLSRGYVCLCSALVVVAEIDAGAPAARGTVEQIEDRLSNAHLKLRIIIFCMTKPAQKQSPARVVNTEAPAAPRRVTDTPFATCLSVHVQVGSISLEWREESVSYAD